MSPLRFAGKADAYLEWAQHTNFAHVHQPQDEAGLILAQRNGSIVSATLPIDKLEEMVLSSDVIRAELAAPVNGYDKAVNLFPLGDVEQTIPVILGVIDDGCPFARLKRLHSNTYRVQLLWDQNPVPATADGVRYGRVLEHTDLKLQPGEIDTEAYKRVGLKNLRRRATHGAHVLDVLAGAMPPRSRVSPSRMVLERARGDAHLPPPWTLTGDAASKAPIYFVQLPKDAIEDPTGRWLARYALDGLDFIIGNALKQWGNATKGKQLVVNLSWGPQTGPHDGSSLLEEAIDQRVASCGKEGVTLNVTLPAGNSYQARSHAQFDLNKGCQNLTWQVMPGLRAPQFLEIWWPAGTQATDLDVEVHSPGGQRLRFKGTNLPQGQRGAVIDTGYASAWMLTVVPHLQRFMALLALAPTDPLHEAPAPTHGHWRISVGKASAPAGQDRLVHVYIARNAANMGGRRRGPDSYLYDALYESTRHGRWPERVEPEGSLVRREGTLSGIATGKDSRVVGGYVLSKDAPEAAAQYTSSGPGSGAGGRHPDWALPSDESPYLPGIRAGAVREGSSIRLVGTSAAAPQLARRLANGTVPVTSPPPAARGDPLPPPDGTAPPPVAAPAPDPRLGSGRQPMRVDAPNGSAK